MGHLSIRGFENLFRHSSYVCKHSETKTSHRTKCSIMKIATSLPVAQEKGGLRNACFRV